MFDEKAYRKEYNAKYYAEKKGEIKAYKKKYYCENRDKILAQKREYGQRNKGKINALSVSKKARRIQRTPPWSNLQSIEEFYLKSSALKESTGHEYHVDHIIPLNGERVSGLHVPANLQVLRAKDNLSKGNTFVVD